MKRLTRRAARLPFVTSLLGVGLRLGLGFALLSAGCALFTLASKGRSYPETEGALSVEGAAGEITISRDEYGVPHIRAASEADAWYGVGFAHAQDRLFQLDLVRRLAFGRLSEWLGEDPVDLDIFMKGFGFEARAADGLRLTSPEVRAALTAYAAGINAGARSLKTLPVEYRLLDATWDEWRPEDSAALIFLNSLNLSSNPGIELAALLLKDKTDAAGMDALFRHDRDSPPIDPYWDTLRALKIGGLSKPFRAFNRTLLGVAAPQASNNWVVGPGRSADGAAIVANDPHLAQSVPSLWYVADIQGGPLHVAGATFPGSPFVLTGHTAQLAWGVTNTMADYIDLAVLRRVGDKGYLLAGE